MKKDTPRKTDARLKLILLQSGICLITVLLALLLRFAGGNVFEELRESFRTAVEEDSFLSEIQKNTTIITSTTSLTLPKATTSTTPKTTLGND